MTDAPLLREVIWRRLPSPGLEHCTLRAVADGAWQLEGVAVAALDTLPVDVRYTISGTAAWQTRAVAVELRTGAVTRALHLRVDDQQRWWNESEGGGELVALRGCHDVDLGISPSTNTLPIRRLGLAVGASADLDAGWVRFPELAVEPLAQRYTRIGDRAYRYESRGSSFRADLSVDEEGLVVAYPGAWMREG